MKIKIEIEIEMASSCQDCRKYQDCLFLGNLLKGLIDTFSGRNLHHGCYSYHKLLRQPQRWCCRASVFLSFPSALGCILFMLYCFGCHISGGGTTHLLLFIRAKRVSNWYIPKKKSARVPACRVHVCTCAIILVLVCGIMYHIRTYLVSARYQPATKIRIPGM